MVTRMLVIAAVPVLAALGGCAALPADRGRSDVAALLDERALRAPVLADPDAARRLMDELREQPLSIATAVKMALVNNPEMKRLYARLGFAAADVYDAGRATNPTFSASVLIPHLGGRANQLDFGLVQSFADLLLLPARRRFAEGEFTRAKELVAAATLNVASEAQQQYFKLVSALQMVEMREVLLQAAQSSAELAQRFFDAGNITRLALNLEQAAAAEAHLELLLAQSAATAARSEMNRVMGFPAAEDAWTIEARMPAPPAGREGVTELLGVADASRLDLAAARRNVSLAADALGVTRAFRYLGSFDIGVSTERQTEGSHITGPTFVLELPIFNRGEGRVARSEAHLAQVEAELHSLEVEISNAVSRAAADVDAARARAEQYVKTVIPLRESIVARTLEEVNFMLTGQFELLVAKQQEYDAYRGYMDAVRDYWLARVELARQMGVALPLEMVLDAAPIVVPGPASRDDVPKSEGGGAHEDAERGQARQPIDQSALGAPVDAKRNPGADAPADAPHQH